MSLNRLDIPIAISLLELARRCAEPFQEFMCYWTAFNNIYAVIADSEGLCSTLRLDANGEPKTEIVSGVRMAKVDTPREREQIDFVFLKFSDKLKHNVIAHEATRFFVDRTPEWQGQRLERDGFGQALNGVLKVSRTTSKDFPVWSPIDTASYERYVHGTHSTDNRDRVSKQILDVLYTVRNNLVHGSKAVDDANSREVIKNALPLLKMIVESFLA